MSPVKESQPLFDPLGEDNDEDDPANVEEEEEEAEEVNQHGVDPADDSEELGMVEASSPAHMQNDLHYLHRSLQKVCLSLNYRTSLFSGTSK